MRLGISSYTYVWSVGVAGYPQPAQPMTVSGLLDEASALEVDVVQIADNLPLDRLSAEELLRLARQAQQRGIELETGTRGIDRDRLLKYLEISTRLNSQILRVVIDPEDAGEDPTQRLRHATVDDVVGAISDVAAPFEEADVRLAIENHDRFPAATLRQIMERVDSSHVGICLDTANSIGCIESAPFVLRALEPWIVNVHLKDYRIVRPTHQKGFVVEGRPVGGGQLDVAGLIRRLNEIGYQRNVIVELWPPPQESTEASIRLEHRWARESVQFLREVLRGE